jgi:hypothetical protein
VNLAERNQDPEEKVWFTIQDLAKEWGPISEGWIRDHASGRKQPAIRAHKFGKRLMVHRDDKQAFLQKIATLRDDGRAPR